MAASIGLTRTMTKPGSSPTQRRALLDRFFGYDYFIAHRSADGKAYARALHERLTGVAARFRCFIDRHHYALGGDLPGMQTAALRKSARLIVVVTPGAHAPPATGEDWLLKEVREFKASRGTGAVIVPIGTPSLLDPASWPSSPLLAEIPHWPHGNCLLETDASRLAEAPSDETIARLILDFTERRQERTRLRVFQSLSAALALLLLTAVTLGTIAHFARQRAARNEQRARVSKVAAEGIVDDMLRELGRKLEEIGKLELLENVTTAAESYFARMDPELRDAQTETHAALAAMTSGDILRQKGDHTAAREQYAKAEAQLTQLAAAAPGNARLWRDLGNARNNLATVALLADDHVEQAAWLARAAPAIAEAARLEPANFNYRREGLLMHIRMLDESAPTAEWETLVAETKQLLRDNPNSLNVRLVSFASEGAAQAWEKHGDLEKAAALLTSATQIIFDVEKFLPEDAGVQLDLADCLHALAQLERKRGRSEQSINAIEAAESVSRSLRQRDPLNQEWIGQYAQLLSVSADLHVAAGQLEGGLARAREATALLRGVQERHPATRQYKRDAALALATFGHQLAKANAWSDAMTTWSGSAELLERLSAIGGLTAEQEVTLAIIHRSLAEAALSPTPPDIAGARAFLAKALSRLRALQASGKLPSGASSFVTAWEQRDQDLADP